MTTTINPSTIRSRLEQIKSEMSSLERDIQGPIRQGIPRLGEVSFELAEASEGVDRALKFLDENYKTLS